MKILCLYKFHKYTDSVKFFIKYGLFNPTMLED